MVKTLLFTDVVDSTRLTAELGDLRMADIWVRHDDIARDLMKLYHGKEIDRTDGFFVLFDNVHDAILFANKLHELFSDLSKKEAIDFRTRIGIHTGQIILIEGSGKHEDIKSKKIEVEGLSKSAAARVMNIARGGQTLLSSEALAALAAPKKFLLKSHGYWQLKGISEPVELFEVGNSRSSFIPPEDTEKAYRVHEKAGILVPVREMKFYLPAERNAFIGRQPYLRSIWQLIDGGAKLITVTGTGGIGKSRLARYFGWRWLGEFEGGVWFCNLVEARSIEGIASAVASTLNIHLGKGNPVDQLGYSFLGRGKCLIILDNFEQITQFVYATVEKWLELAPQTCFIVTSREVLNVMGEQIINLKPLSFEEEGVNLFEERAKSRKASFRITEENKNDVENIVSILEGLPLAIELAAARISILNPRQIKERLKDRFKFLSGIKGREKRHQALRHTIDWSWDMLREWEKSALAQCSVFDGGFTLESAESVIDLSVYDNAPTVIDVIQSLVEKSLIRSDIGRFDLDELWYGMYISINEYSAEKLRNPNGFSSSGLQFEQQTWKRHGMYYSQFGSDEFIDRLRKHGGEKKLLMLVEDFDNLFIGMSRAIRRMDIDQASFLLSGAWQVLIRKGPYNRIEDPAKRLTASVPISEKSKLRVLKVLVAYELENANLDAATQHIEEALEISHKLGDQKSESAMLVDLGTVFHYKSEYLRAEKYCSEALELAQIINDKQNLARSYNLKGSIAGYKGDLDSSLENNFKALEIAVETGDSRMEANLLNNLSVIFSDQANFNDAAKYGELALSIVRQIGNRLTECVVLGNLGNTLCNLGQFRDAAKLVNEGLEISKELGAHRHEVFLLLTLGNVYLCHGDNELSKSTFERGLELAIKTGNKRNEGAILSYLGSACFNLGQSGKARNFFSKADKVLKESKNRAYECVNLHSLSVITRTEGDYTTALSLSEKSKQIAQELGLHDIEAMIDTNIGNILSSRGQYASAILYYEKAAAQLKKMNVKLPLAELLIYWSESAINNNDLILAKEKFDLASNLMSEFDLLPSALLKKDFERVKKTIRELNGD